MKRAPRPLLSVALLAAFLAGPGCDASSDLPPASLDALSDGSGQDARDSGRTDHRPYGDPGPWDPGSGTDLSGADGTGPDAFADDLPGFDLGRDGAGDDVPAPADPGRDAPRDPGAGDPSRDDSCLPDCRYAACGDDGCGGSCGTCEDGAVCVEGGCDTPDSLTCPQGIECSLGCGDDATCFQSCVTRVTGPDAVTWNALLICVYQRCPDALSDPVAIEACAREVCRAEAEACYGGCIPDCGGRECGDDGCGGSCGTCGGGTACVEGSCVPEGATACADIVDCALACGTDYGCILACDDDASPAEQQRFAALMKCAMSYCTGTSGDPSAFVACVYESCPDQAADCMGG